MARTLGKDHSSISFKEGAHKFIKYASLFLLVGQMVGLVLLMRYTRTHTKGDELYLATTAVFIMELSKFVICCFVIFYQCKCSVPRFTNELINSTYGSPMEVLKLCVPSLLYTVQNNLLYFALTNLDAATYQVCYQLKILTTALFSAILLGRRFSALKWAALVMLTVGVAVVEGSGSKDEHSKNASNEQHNRFIGLVAVLCAACTSGFSGVYFEKILKGSPSVSLWIRNVQMGLPSIIIAYITVYARDGATVREKGFFVGYSSLVWTVVMVQAGGGLLVAVVVKYADNVLKVFATSFSIIISCMVSAVLFGFRPTWQFALGSSLVMASTVLYARPDRKKKKPLLPTTISTSSKKSLTSTTTTTTKTTDNVE